MQFQILIPFNQEQKPPSNAIRFKVQDLEPEFSVEEMLTELATIFTKYRSWNDFTSKKIREWGGKIFANINEDDLKDPENHFKRMETNIYDLFNKILISPFMNPYKEPILDGNYTWEKSELINFYAKFVNTTGPKLYSPFGKEIKVQMREDGIHFPSMKIHEFALEMIKWANNLPVEPVIVNPQLPSIHHNVPLPHLLPEDMRNTDLVNVDNNINNFRVINPEEKLMGQLQNYQASARLVMNQFAMLQMTEAITMFAVQLKTSREEIEEYTRLSILRSTADAKRQKEEVERSISQANESRAEEVKVFEARIEDHKIHIQNQYETLSYQEQQLALKSARINHLAELYRQEQLKVNHMANSDRGSGGGCTLI